MRSRNTQILRHWAAAAFFVLAPVAGAQAGTGIYSYVDSEGVVHFTDSPRDSRYERVVLSDARITPIRRRQSNASSGSSARGKALDRIIGANARAQRIQPALVKAVIRAESNFDPGAISKRGAQGLMQLMPSTAASLGVVDPLHPADNVWGGTRYLRAMLDRYGDVSFALAAYNAGPTAVDQYGGVPPFPETQDYVQRVLTYYRNYHGDFAR